jgi:hypothetical protein
MNNAENFDSNKHPRNLDNGKYVEQTFSAPDISDLTYDPTDTYNADTTDAAYDYAVGVRHSDPRISRAASSALKAETERTISMLRRKNGLSFADSQDATSDTFAQLAGNINRGGVVRGGLIQDIAVKVCSQYVNGPVRHETAKAIRLLKQRVAEEEARVGHHISPAEVAAIATDVRMGPDFNYRHRPQEEFHLIQDFVRPTSFSQFPDSYIDEKMHEFGYSDGSTFDGQDTASDRLAESIEMKDTTRAEGLKRLWEVTAEDQEVPQATANRIGRADAAKVQAYMTEQKNGVMSACRDHEDGIDNKSTYALFAPFAGLTEGDRDQIVSVLMERSGHAEALWTSALNAATKSAEIEREEKAAARDIKREKAAAVSAAAKAVRTQAAHVRAKAAAAKAEQKLAGARA